MKETELVIYVARAPYRVSKILEVEPGRLGIYNNVDEALRDEHIAIQSCKRKGSIVELLQVTQTHTLLRVDKNGRITGRKKADSIAY